VTCTALSSCWPNFVKFFSAVFENISILFRV
jgi:hypothetical protein